MREKKDKNTKIFLYKFYFGSIVFSILIGTFLVTTNISAVHDSVSVKVDATCSISASNGSNGNYTISIIPGASSEIVGTPINASCNDANGYDLYAIGYSNDNYTVRNTELISTINDSYNIQTATSGDNSYWAMKVAGSGTDAPIIDNSFGSYQPIPSAYTLISHRTKNTVGTVNSITTPTYKINVSASQVADTYTGKDRYILTHPNLTNDMIDSLTMQEVTDFNLAALMPDSGDTATLRDARDNNEYEITNVDGTYWMTQNLRLTNTSGESAGTVLAENSNFATNITFNGDLSSGNSYTAAYYHVPTEAELTTLGLTANEVGVYYNFCAASAGTVCNDTTTQSAEVDICPSGWRLPTSTETSAAVEQLATINAVNSGYYSGGKLSKTYGYFWSSTDYDTLYQYRLRYNGSALQNSYMYKYTGANIRCVRATDYVTTTVKFAGSGIESVTFYNPTYGTKVASSNGDMVSLKSGVAYIVTATMSDGSLSEWKATNGTLSSTTTNPTTYTPASSATITAVGGTVLKIDFKSLNAYGVLVKSTSITGQNIGTVTTPGGVLSVTPGTNYYLIPLYKSKYKITGWTATNGSVTAGTYGYYYYTPASGLNTVTLTATTLGTSSSVIMQNLSASTCTSVPTAVKDSRDNAVYYIQRLADGKCWMLENLRLGSTSSTYTLTSDNSNVSSDFVLPKSGTVCFSPNSCTGTDGATTGTGYTVPAINADDKSTTKTGYGTGRNYIGVYYNFCAASAGTACTATVSNSTTYDICPAGWQLPLGSKSVGGAYYLYTTALGSNASSTIYSLSVPRTGAYYDGASISQNSYGFFWSSTRYSETVQYYTRTSAASSFSSRLSAYNRTYGMSVRCVLKE